jgi:hypothetical protein
MYTSNELLVVGQKHYILGEIPTDLLWNRVVILKGWNDQDISRKYLRWSLQGLVVDVPSDLFFDWRSGHIVFRKRQSWIFSRGS